VDVVSFDHKDSESYIEQYKNLLDKEGVDLNGFINDIKSNFLSGQKYSVPKDCINGDQACEAFVESGRNAADYNLYNAFI